MRKILHTLVLQRLLNLYCTTKDGIRAPSQNAITSFTLNSKLWQNILKSVSWRYRGINHFNASDLQTSVPNYAMQLVDRLFLPTSLADHVGLVEYFTSFHHKSLCYAA